MTIQEALSIASARLRDVEDANLIIYSIFTYVLNLSKEYIWAHPDTFIEQANIDLIMSLIDRAYQHEPLAYLTGEKEFYGLPFYVTQDTLIPRPESELIIDQSRAYLSKLALASDEQPVLADIGTGSGCLAITLATIIPNSTIYAIDVSFAALEVARRNAARHNATNVVFIQGSFLEPLEGLVERLGLDLIVANLPYISDAEFESLPHNVRNYEPELALRSGSDPDMLNRQLLSQAKNYLRAEGKLIYETTNGFIVELDAVDLI